MLTKKSKTAKKRKKTHKKTRYVLLVLAFLFAVGGFAFQITFAQIAAEIENVTNSADDVLNSVEMNYSARQTVADATVSAYDSIRASRTNLAAVYLHNLPPETAETPDLGTLAGKLEAERIYLLDGAGNTLQSSGGSPLNVKDANGSLRQMLDEGTVGEADGKRYYSTAYGEGYLVTEYSAALLQSEDADSYIAQVLVDTTFDSDGFLFAVDPQDNTYIYYPDGSLDGQPAPTNGEGIPLKDGSAEWVAVGTDLCYCVARASDGDDGRYLFVAARKLTSLFRTFSWTVAMPLMVFLLIVAAVLMYAVILLVDSQHHREEMRYWSPKRFKKLLVNTTLLEHLVPVACVGLVLLCGFSFYIQILMNLSRAGIRANDVLDQIEKDLEDNTQITDSLDENFDTQCVSQAQLVAWMIDQEPALLEEEQLNLMASVAGIGEIYLFDIDGRVTNSNTGYVGYSLSKDENDPSSKFWSVLDGDAESAVVAEPETDGEPGKLSVGVRRIDAPGLVRLTSSSQALEVQKSGYSLMATLMNASVGGGFAFAVSADETFAFYPLGRWVDMPITNYGLTVDISNPNYAGYQEIDGQRYYVNSRQYKDLTLCIATASAGMQGGSLNTVSTACSSALLILVLLVLITTVNFGSKPAEEPMTEAEKAAAAENTNRWLASRGRWRDKPAEQKFSSLLMTMVGICVMVLTLNVYNMGRTGDPDSIFNYIMQGRWERGLNIFSLTAIGMVFAVVLVFSWVIRKLILMLAHALGPRGETVGHLLDSFIKYMALLGTAFYCLNLLGINTGTLVASAGVLSVVVGLGAQSLIGDILAGIFIVFEGEFRVGDIVSVGEWRGTVLEIGVRTTKIEDISNNIKIINNSTITSVVNMTREYSYAVCDVDVEYGENLQRVEAVLDEEFPLMKKQLPEIAVGPYYGGVMALGSSGVTIRVMAQCKEEDRIMLARALNRAVKLAFDKHGISVPFPQVVVHKADVASTPATTAAELKKSSDLLENFRSPVGDSMEGGATGNDNEE